LVQLKTLVDSALDEADDISREILELMNNLSGRRFASGRDKIARLAKHFTKDQIEGVIYHKAQTWLNDEKMSQYFRPATIFKNKPSFEAYVDDSVNYWTEHVRRSK
jgi:uncharacterized phage protein (TIGR02220 family)